MSSLLLQDLSRSSISNPSVEVYKEDTQHREIHDGDIDKFAKLIGVDLSSEPQLRPLVEEGLLAPLPPEWKICKDESKNEWFYHNRKTRRSQWDHPLNEVYRERVRQKREEIAMNHVTGLPLSRPPKSLPPLRKVGASRPPPGPQPPAQGQGHGPLTLSKVGRLEDNLSGSRPQLEGKAADSFGNSVSASISSSEPKKELPPPSSRQVKKPIGLILTGQGAHFMKGKDKDKVDSDKHELIKPRKNDNDKLLSNEKEKGSEGESCETGKETKPLPLESEFSEVEVSGSICAVKSKPKPSKLVSNLNLPSSNENATEKRKVSFDEDNDNQQNQNQNQPGSGQVKKGSALDFSKKDVMNVIDSDQWNLHLRPEFLTEQERQIVSELELDLNLQSKDEGKFQLDDNTELKFDPLESDTSDHTRSRTRDFRNDQDQDIDSEGDSRVAIARKGDSKFRNAAATATFPVKVDGSGEQAGLPIQKIQESIDQERKDKEAELRKQMELTLSDLKKERDMIISKVREDIEQERDAEIKTLRKELEEMMEMEVAKLKLRHELELENKKDEMQADHETALLNLFDTLSDPEKNSIISKRMSETTQKFQAELKQHKESLKEEQLKQIQQIKDYHQSFAEKLKRDLHSEELRLQQEQKARLREISEKMERETAHLQQQLKMEQSLKLKSLREDFDREKAALQRDLEEGLKGVRAELDSLPKRRPVQVRSTTSNSNSPAHAPSAPTPKSQKELDSLTEKYEMLEQKYNSLRRELKRITGQGQGQSPGQGGVHSLPVKRTSPRTNPTGSAKGRLFVRGKTRKPPGQSESQRGQSKGPDETASFISVSSEDESSDFEENDRRKVFTPSSMDLDEGRSEMQPPTETETEVKLQDALKSLDILKHQIMQIKKKDDAPPRKPKGQGQSPTIQVKPGNRIPLRQPPKRNNAASSQTTNYPNNFKSVTTNLTRNKLLSRNSKSTGELPGLIEDLVSEPENAVKIVREAQEFIRAQKEQMGQRNNNKQVTSSNPPHLGLFSDQESSGFGSMISGKTNTTTNQPDMRSNEKRRISKDIEAICSSLSHLDEQMKMMWSVVNVPAAASSNASSYNKLVPTTSSTSRLSNPVEQHLQSYPNLFPPKSENAFNLLATTPLLAKLTPSHLLNTLDKELQEFKATKERILSQFSNGGAATFSSSNSHPNLNSSRRMSADDSEAGKTEGGKVMSVRDKAQDLKDWLEKF